ncbi:hypothetical protein LUZ61_011931 [Rhynchospora tenuis]|uniref:BTB domain-containing protein n=1 Tax=Rhynchospora tenuis TaxID=198213 RepID=A0AAD6A1Y5_9POAL|nr:hypothetical protein LUZ61_011931 [Rhynchospora tenuis]
MASSQLFDDHYRTPKPPPPLPSPNYGRDRIYLKKFKDCLNLHEEKKEIWDKVFKEGYGADVCVVTGKDDVHFATGGDRVILAHSCILVISSPVLRSLLEKAPIKNNFKIIKISGVTQEVARVFIRFLYSSCYEEEEMKKNAIHLLVLSHAYSVPSLKKLCIYHIEKSILTKENVVDLLQLARGCDAARLAYVCTRLIFKDFKSVSGTEGWKVMRDVNPTLEQELLEFLVEADSRKLERSQKREEHQTYFLLYEAMEALVHISQDGCRNIWPADKSLNHIESQGGNCSFPACKRIELLVRHFRGCDLSVPGGCADCKRMWQLLELHSRMCSESYYCTVPLCRYFKEKMQNLNKKEKQKWDLLVSRVRASKGTLSSICYMKVS